MILLGTLLVIFLAMSSSYAAPLPTDNEAEAKIIKYENTNDGSGNYFFSYETSNGIKREETGTLLNSGQPDAHIAVKGSISYINAEGETISFKYSADENGYHVSPSIKDDIENPPSLSAPPPAVLASLLGG